MYVHSYTRILLRIIIGCKGVILLRSSVFRRFAQCYGTILNLVSLSYETPDPIFAWVDLNLVDRHAY
eukprot:SAG31_NODE_7979_length_1550_cov_1.048243_2_plen_67_part_00